MPQYYEIAVVAHLSRYKIARQLATRVGANCLSVDNGSLADGFNHLRAWNWLGNGDSEWSIVLEDDAIPDPWFLSDIGRVLESAPSPVCSFYLGRSTQGRWQSSIQQVIARPEPWLLADELLHHVGVAVKTSLLPLLLDGVDTLLAAYPIDEALGVRCRRIGVQIAYSNPSIVDHDWKLPSVIKTHRSQREGESGVREINDARPRKAWRFDENRSTWTSETFQIPSP